MATEIVTRKLIEKRKRGFFGWIFLLLFFGFNILMLIGLFAGVSENAKQATTISDARLRQAHDAGTGLGIMVLLVFWAAGAVVFGLLAHFTRGKREMIEVETRTRG